MHGFFNLLKQVGQGVGEKVGHENLSGTEVGRIFPVKRDLAGDFPESSNQTSRLSKLNSPRDSRSNDYNHHYNPIQSRQIPKIPRIRSPKSEWGKTSRSECPPANQQNLEIRVGPTNQTLTVETEFLVGRAGARSEWDKIF